MPQSIVSSKGQIVIPKSVRDLMGIKEGTRLEFSSINDNVVISVIKDTNDETLDDLIAKAKLISPENRPNYIDIGAEPIINDGWVGKSTEEYKTADEFLKEWNDFCAK